ncbi:hypothetical protein D3C78_1362550 [compost metagenome]
MPGERGKVNKKHTGAPRVPLVFALPRFPATNVEWVESPKSSVDSQRAQSPPDGLLEIVAHPNQLGADFGDAYLEPGESLSALLEQRLPGVPRVAYTAAGDAAPRRAQAVLE